MRKPGTYIGHFGGNEALTELINKQQNKVQKTDLRYLETDLTLSSLVNVTVTVLVRNRTKKTSPLYVDIVPNF